MSYQALLSDKSVMGFETSVVHPIVKHAMVRAPPSARICLDHIHAD